MKALVYENYAQDDNFESVLELRDIPEPIPKHNEVVFRVKAAALNYERKATCCSLTTHIWN